MKNGKGVAPRSLTRLQHTLYELHQNFWSARLRRRHQRAFDGVSRFCLFIGYPRSGHSIVGALLNAHRDAVISHELDAPQLILGGCTRDDLYSRILARAQWFHWRGNTSNYNYQVPHQWQGRFEALRVIGDKRGGAVARCMAEHPDFLQRLRSLVGVPIRLVHVVRNPFDNISAISIWHKLPVEDSIEFYFDHCASTARLGAICDPSEVITICHEDMVRASAPVVSSLCNFLDLDLYPGYLEDCDSIVFGKPTYTRRKVTWSAALIRDVERRAKAYPFLDGYAFEIPDSRNT